MTTSLPTKPDASLLERIFPPHRIPKSEIGGIGPELGDYIADFGDRAWSEVADETYRTHTDVYCLMDPESLIHYIAGFMRLALFSNYSGGDEFFIYFASSDRFVTFCDLLTIQQRRYMIGFVDFYIQSDYYSDSERIPYATNREHILRTLETTTQP